jgi:hypothetical protein
MLENPNPDNEIVWGAWRIIGYRDRGASRRAATVGVKVTLIVQFAFTASDTQRNHTDSLAETVNHTDHNPHWRPQNLQI